MTIPARYVHTNVVARDWKRLARFYQEVFGCVPVGPERDFSGEWLERATAVAGARIRGAHFRLPGYGDAGPTLEIFQYDPYGDRGQAAVNSPGLAHIAFAVDDVKEAWEAVIRAGGTPVGEVTTTSVQGVGAITFAYVADPEGNIIELQKWSR